MTDNAHILRVDQAIGFALDVEQANGQFESRKSISITYRALRDRLQRRKATFNKNYPSPKDVVQADHRQHMQLERAEITRDQMLLDHLLRFINNINDDGCVSFLPPEEQE